jgi:four helix bundle protein
VVRDCVFRVAGRGTIRHSTKAFGAGSAGLRGYRAGVQDYKRLRVWEKAHNLALSVREATNRWPRSGYAALKGQITRAAESIAFNVVEGCGATTQRELARFLEIAIKSTLELEYQLTLARDYALLDHGEWEALAAQTIDVRRMLCGLRKKVLENDLNAQRSNR